MFSCGLPKTKTKKDAIIFVISRAITNDNCYVFFRNTGGSNEQ